MTAMKRTRMHRLPKLGDNVTPVGSSQFVADIRGKVGRVVDVIDGACGPIVAVQFADAPGRTFDLFWKKVRRA